MNVRSAGKYIASLVAVFGTGLLIVACQADNPTAPASPDPASAGPVAGLASSAPTAAAAVAYKASPGTVCDSLEGDLFGICHAYCEAMNCDGPDRHASDRACEVKLQQWSARAGDAPLPCNELPEISLAKSVAAEIPVGDPVVYTFEVANTGNVAVVLTGLTDPDIAGLLTACDSGIVGQTLEANGSLSCDSDFGLVATSGPVSNTAAIQGASIYGTPVSATGSATYTGLSGSDCEIPEPPDGGWDPWRWSCENGVAVDICGFMYGPGSTGQCISAQACGWAQGGCCRFVDGAVDTDEC